MKFTILNINQKEFIFQVKFGLYQLVSMEPDFFFCHSRFLVTWHNTVMTWSVARMKTITLIRSIDFYIYDWLEELALLGYSES